VLSMMRKSVSLTLLFQCEMLVWDFDRKTAISDHRGSLSGEVLCCSTQCVRRKLSICYALVSTVEIL
jgi:hypothetical protein